MMNMNTNTNMYMYMDWIESLQPKVPDWAQAEKMELSYAQIDLWKNHDRNPRSVRKGI